MNVNSATVASEVVSTVLVLLLVHVLKDSTRDNFNNNVKLVQKKDFDQLVGSSHAKKSINVKNHLQTVAAESAKTQQEVLAAFAMKDLPIFSII